jgi:hypothetical protein
MVQRSAETPRRAVDLLEEAVARAIAALMPHNAAAWFRHCDIYYRIQLPRNRSKKTKARLSYTFCQLWRYRKSPGFCQLTAPKDTAGVYLI